MKRTVAVAPLLAVLLLSPAVAGDANVVKGELGEKLDRAVQIQTKGGFWGTVLIAKGGEPVLAKGYGNADYAARPNTPRTLFEVASVSKMFTATAILKLEMQGKLKTTDTLGKLFDKVPDDKKNITIHQLLTHTSGMSPDMGLAYDAKETRDEFAAYVLGHPLASEPDEKFEYCNSAYALLAAIVEKASGESFESYSRKNIFEPAGMKDTGFINDEHLDDARAAKRLSGTTFDRSAARWNWSWGYRGMGGVVTTAEDLLKFDRALRANQVLDAETQKKQTTPSKDVAGSGCFIEKTFRGTRRIYHSGGVAGFVSMFSRYMEDDLVVVILSNDGADPSGLENALVNVLYPPPSAALTLLVGDDPSPDALIMKEGTSWKGTRADADVQLEISRREKVHVRLKLTQESAKNVLVMLKDALDERAREKITEADSASIETDVYHQSYDAEGGKVEIPKTLVKVMPSYVGEHDGEKKEDHRITFILVDEATSGWPLIVKMNSTSTKALVKEIESALAGK